MKSHSDHRTRAEDALAHARSNPVLSSEQSFLSAIVHSLLALESRLEEVGVALSDPRLLARPDAPVAAG